MIQVEPCTLPPGFVAWRDGINEQWAECPWKAAELAARSEPMTERVTTAEIDELAMQLNVAIGLQAALSDPKWEAVPGKLRTLAADRDALLVDNQHVRGAALQHPAHRRGGQRAKLPLHNDACRPHHARGEGVMGEATIKVLRIMADNGGRIRPARLAEQYFGPNSLVMQRVGKCGPKGATQGVGGNLWAGGFLGKLRKRGLVEYVGWLDGYQLTAEGRKALKDTKEATNGE